MIFDSTELFVNFEMDIMALLILFGMVMIPQNSDEKKDTGARIFIAMGIFIVIGVVSEILIMLFSDNMYSWRSAAILVPGIAFEVSITALLFLFFMYTDYELYESRDHLKRHLVSHIVPVILFVAVCLLLPWLKKILGIEGLLITNIFILTEYLELIYLLLTALHFVSYYRKYGEKRFFHPLSIYVPILFGALFTFFTTFTGVFLGFALGLLFLVFSKIDSYRFQDREYQFYNEHYLKYILSLVESGTEDRKSVIMFTAKKDARALSRILKQELPAGSEVISLGNGRFLYLSKLESRIEIEALRTLVLDAALEYDEGHEDSRIDLEASFRVYDNFTEVKEVLSGEG